MGRVGEKTPSGHEYKLPEPQRKRAGGGVSRVEPGSKVGPVVQKVEGLLERLKPVDKEKQLALEVAKRERGSVSSMRMPAIERELPSNLRNLVTSYNINRSPLNTFIERLPTRKKDEDIDSAVFEIRVILLPLKIDELEAFIKVFASKIEDKEISKKFQNAFWKSYGIAPDPINNLIEKTLPKMTMGESETYGKFTASILQSLNNPSLEEDFITFLSSKIEDPEIQVAFKKAIEKAKSE